MDKLIEKMRKVDLNEENVMEEDSVRTYVFTFDDRSVSGEGLTKKEVKAQNFRQALDGLKPNSIHRIVDVEVLNSKGENVY